MGKSKTQRQIDDLQNQIDELKARIDSISDLNASDVIKLQKEIDNLKSIVLKQEQLNESV